MKTITLNRVRNASDCTIGVLTVGKAKFATLEDKVRKDKVHGETAIPAGTYELGLRAEGGMTKRYARKFPDMHKGMIWLQDVPGFTWVYIHIGNFPEDTLGCILVGERAGEDMVHNSRTAYENIYPKIVRMIEAEGCQISITDVPQQGVADG